MQNQRIILISLLALISFLLFDKWQTANAPKPKVTQTTAQSNSIDTAPSLLDSQSSDLPLNYSPNNLIQVKTDVLNVTINKMGGDIISLSLPTYPESIDDPNQPFALLAQNKNKLFIAQSGLLSKNNAFLHDKTLFSSKKTVYQLNNQEQLEIPLSFKDPKTGITLTKTFIFTKGSFDIKIKQNLTNNSDSEWVGTDYLQLVQKEPNTEKSAFLGASSYTGAVVSIGDLTYEKLPFNKLSTNEKEEFKKEGLGGWIAMIQQYFTVAFVPHGDINHLITAGKLNDTTALVRIRRTNENLVSVAPRSSYEFATDFYAGPKIKADLQAVGSTKDDPRKLDLTLDYGWFSPISTLMLIILEFFHKYVHNWGWSIVLLTFTVKLALFWFSERGYRSMAKMRLLAPQMQLLKEQYGNDRQKMGQETIALYRKEKVNPMGGCWPMLIQIPIFIALFWMLQESVQLRQASWLWIKDLSVMDPYFILPIIMCATMFIQQKFNPTPTDPTQAKIMKWMPIIFGFMFMWFAAGIVLYWVVNNTLTILQQWLINKRMEKSYKHK